MALQALEYVGHAWFRMAAEMLPRAIHTFQKTHPKIRFTTFICGREEVYQYLKEFRADIGAA